MMIGVAKMKWVALAVMAVAALFHYRSMFGFTAYLFSDPLEDMSHGWIVPIVSVYVLWRQRKMLRESAGCPSWMGAAWVLFFLMVAWFGSRGGQSRVEQVSFIGLVWAIPYAFWGRGVERLLRFPAAYLLFTVPVSSFIDFFTIHLRMASVLMATGILNGFGMAVERSGTALFSHSQGGTFNVDVADPCSGIRSLFAMMALTAAYAYITLNECWKKWSLFICSLPIAVIGNMVRIMSICVVASWCGQDVALGYYHDYSGFVIFVVGVYLMFFVGEQVKKINIGRLVSNSGLKSGAQGEKRGSLKSDRGIVAGVGVLALAVFMAGNMIPAPEYGAASFVADALPERVGDFGGDIPWFCQDPQCMETAEERGLKKGVVDRAEGYVCPGCGKLLGLISLGEATLLPKDTVIRKRNYRAADGVAYAVSVVIQGRMRNSIHRAELCLPSQGFIMDRAERVALRLQGREGPLWVRKINAHRSGGGAGMSLVYWFESRDRECCSHTQRILLDVWDRSMHNRINRWVMVAVNVSSPLDSPESVARFETFIAEFYSKIIKQRLDL